MATDEEADQVFGIAQMLAQYGKDNSNEAALRSAVSRGYYSVFLAAQQRTGCTDRNDIHGKVYYACSQPRNLGFLRSQPLRWMKELRASADYFRAAEPIEGQEPPHNLSDWNANWIYVETQAPIVRKNLKSWKA